MEFEFMRLWSIHPKYLDTIGLVALWREALLAQKVLRGETRGYKSHPQLKRFREHSSPKKAIGNFLVEIWKESKSRGYNFNKEKIETVGKIKKISVTHVELSSEFSWLRDKLKKRDPRKYKELFSIKNIDPHPLFQVIEG
jgi:hypothetical protein